MLIFRKSIIILDLWFFYIVKVEKKIVNDIFSKTFSTYFYFIKRSGIKFIIFKSL